MAWFNEEVAGLLREYAELTQIIGGDVFRARNYEKAARSVRGWADDISRLDLAAAMKAGRLDGLAGFGARSEERTDRGLQVDLRVVPLDAWGAALQYFTGSTAHNVAIRQIAIRNKLKLSEYGLFDAETNQLIVSRTEEEVYARLGLAWVPPPMREDHGEIEAAAQGQIPSLVRENDLKGDLHTHTDLGGGTNCDADRAGCGRPARGARVYAASGAAARSAPPSMDQGRCAQGRTGVLEQGDLCLCSPGRMNQTLIGTGS